MKEDIENELREISPFLADLKEVQPDKNGKAEPFRTPKFYFDNLADRVMEKTQPLPPPQYVRKKNVFSQLEEWLSVLVQPRWAMSMATVAILAVGSWFYLKKEVVQPNETLTEITNEDIHEYIENNIEDFDENLLAENAPIASDTEGGDIFKEMSDSEIEDFLNEHFE